MVKLTLHAIIAGFLSIEIIVSIVLKDGFCVADGGEMNERGNILK